MCVEGLRNNAKRRGVGCVTQVKGGRTERGFIPGGLPRHRQYLPPLKIELLRQIHLTFFHDSMVLFQKPLCSLQSFELSVFGQAEPKLDNQVLFDPV